MSQPPVPNGSELIRGPVTSYPAPGSSASARWNLRDLGDALSMVRTRHRVIMPGINTAFTYFGAAGSAFPFHKEDVSRTRRQGSPGSTT